MDPYRERSPFMHASLFSLVAAETPDQVFAWGMEVITADDPEKPAGNRKAIVYIHHPDDKSTVAQHASAEAARSCWSRVVPMEIVWDSDLRVTTPECAEIREWRKESTSATAGDDAVDALWAARAAQDAKNIDP
jgi:hypothetical protein